MKHPQLSILPEDFLATAAPDITTSRIDFTQTPLSEYKGLYAIILDNVLRPTECTTLLRAAESTATTSAKSTKNAWERALINVGAGQQALMTQERNCGRIIWDSRDVVARIWKRIDQVPEVRDILRLENVPKIVGMGPGKRGEVWKFTRPNERMRFLRYEGGEYFRPHTDGCYETPDRRERSYFTLHLYLNNGELDGGEAGENVLVGGATTFHGYGMLRKLDVLPKAGRVLLFQHRDLLHSGDDVVQGVKYTMRTDLMYTLESSKAEAPSRKVPVLEDEPMEGVEEGTDGLSEARYYGF